MALFLAYYIFSGSYPSMVFIFLIVMAAIPLMFGIIGREEKKDLKFSSEYSLLKEHAKALKIFMLLFVGITLTISFVFILGVGGCL